MSHIKHSIALAFIAALVVFTSCSTEQKRPCLPNKETIVQTNGVLTSQREENSETFFSSISKFLAELRKNRSEVAVTDSNAEFELLMTNLEQLNCRVDTRMGFVDKLVRVQEDAKQNDSPDQLLPPTILFITDPVAKIGGSRLLFLSSTQPAQMTILSIDSNMGCRLIYDSWKKNDILDDQNTALDPVASVDWVQPGKFILKEREIDSMSRAAAYPRKYFLTINSRGNYELVGKNWKTDKRSD